MHVFKKDRICFNLFYKQRLFIHLGEKLSAISLLQDLVK